MYSFQHTAAGRVLLGLAGLGVLGTASFWTLRIACAIRLAHQGAVDTTDDAALLIQYAAAAEPPEANRALERAVALNPAAWQAWIGLGSRAEASGDFPRAEQCYRKAAASNRQFQPAWMLANYFFRRDNRPEFATWAGRALRMSYGDPRPVFELCRRVDGSPDLVLDAAAARPDLLRLYLAYLTSEGNLDAAGKTARRLAPQAGPDDLPNLLAYCGRMLDTGTAEGALGVWNELCRRRLLPHQALAPGEGRSLTNGEFAAPPSSLGFDWRIVPWKGVSVVTLPTPACLRIAFSGEQPESCQLLTQTLPLEPARSYRLHYEFRTPGIAPETGLRWRVYASPGNAELAGAPPQLAAPDWQRQELRFSTGADCRLARLVLEYRRSPGAEPIEGSLWLRHISLN
jgi:tetratricopeptide (TPR) repeat protein